MKRVLTLLSFFIVFGWTSFAQEAKYQNKTALIIGNSNYTDAPLKNPENDAKVISQTLREIGFDVLEYTNLDSKGMKLAMREFSEKLKEKPGVGLFYYAGHGIQSDGTNYLVPINSNVEEQFEIEFECIQADRALAVMELSNNPFNIVIMDACRNNPFRSFSRSAGDAGFTAPKNPPTGSIIAFATQPGKTASDGTGNNGLYTQELVKAMKTPGIPIEDVFKQVRINVSRMSDQKQVPQEWSSLMGDFYFVEQPVVVEPTVANNSSSNTGSSKLSIDKTQPEVSFGESTRVTGSIELITLMSGILYIDGEVRGDGQAIPMGYVTPLELPIGRHSLEVRGQSGTWKKEVMVRPNETVKATAEIALASAATSSGRDLGTSKTSNNEDVILIPKDKGDMEIYGVTEVDKKAEPFGGMSTFEMFVKEEIDYPRGYKITGQVQVQFVVEKNGAITDIKMIRGLMPEFDQEAVRVITELPYCWKPALKGGNPVRQTMVFAVPFER